MERQVSLRKVEDWDDGQVRGAICSVLQVLATCELILETLNPKP